jgi:hypothetical protein
VLVGFDTDHVFVETRDAGGSAAAFHDVAARGRRRAGFACGFRSGFGNGSGFGFGAGGFALSLRNVSFRNETGHAGTWATHGWWCTGCLMAKGILRGCCLVRVVECVRMRRVMTANMTDRILHRKSEICST